MNYCKQLFYRVTLASALVLGISSLSDGHAKAQGAEYNNVIPPDEKGAYDVGIRTFENVPMSAGRLTRVQVFYPVDPADPNFDPTDCPNAYTVQGVGGTYQRTSPLCAVQNAAIASGSFPLVVFDHGGGGPGNDAQRLSQLLLFETMASHGFVIAVARHSANNIARVRDLPIVIDFMLGENNPLSGSIDSDRIGLSGFSAGGRATLGAVGGWADQGIIADDRIKAMVVYEPSRDNTLEDLATITIPYLIMGGDRFTSGLITAPEVFEATVNATPRIRVLNPNALHFNYQTDLCPSIEETREAALTANPNQPEPLTNMIYPNPTGCEIDPRTGICRRICNPTMGAAAISACTFWNQGEILINTVGPVFGGGRNICSTLGVDSDFSLDTDPEDGLTDAFLEGIPLFEGNDLWNSDESTTTVPPMPAEDMVPMVLNYTVSFWKRYLAGDGHYMRFLTPGYANTQNLKAVVEIRE